MSVTVEGTLCWRDHPRAGVVTIPDQRAVRTPDGLFVDRRRVCGDPVCIQEATDWLTEQTGQPAFYSPDNPAGRYADAPRPFYVNSPERTGPTQGDRVRAADGRLWLYTDGVVRPPWFLSIYDGPDLFTDELTGPLHLEDVLGEPGWREGYCESADGSGPPRWYGRDHQIGDPA